MDFVHVGCTTIPYPGRGGGESYRRQNYSWKDVKPSTQPQGSLFVGYNFVPNTRLAIGISLEEKCVRRQGMEEKKYMS